MSWSAFLLFSVGIYTGIKFLSYTRNYESLKFLGLTLAAFIFSLMEFGQLLDSFSPESAFGFYADFVFEWGHILALSFVLSSLAIFIRQSKPVFAQFPLIYAGLPFLIVFSYFLVSDTYALKDWLLSIYQGGAILVALLMYSVYTYRNRHYGMVLGGVILFLVTFLMFWYIPVLKNSYEWVWKSTLAISMIVTVYGYEYVKIPLNLNANSTTG